MKRTRPIHRTRSAPGPAIDHWLKWPLLILLAVFVLALFWAREQAEIVLFGLRLLELAAALAVLLAAAYGALVYQDQRRIAAIAALFRRFGYDRDEADIRAHTIYLTQVGYISMRVSETTERRIERIPSYALTFTGAAPSAAEVAAFRARHPA